MPIRFFLEKYRHLAQREIGATPPETIQVLKEHDWLGNVRELEVAVEWGGVFGNPIV